MAAPGEAGRRGRPADSREAARARFAADRERMSRRAIPELISLLESEDLRARFLAEMCLRDAAGT